MRISLLILALAAPGVSLCQVSTAEAEKHIKLASDNIKAKNYIETFNALEKAKVETQKLVSAQIEKAFPPSVENWSMVKENTAAAAAGIAPLGMPGSHSYISISKNYEPAKVETKQAEGTMPMAGMYMQPRIMVTVSNDTFPANNIKMAHSNTSPSPAIPGEEVKATTIKNYKAVTRFASMMKMGTISILTGKGVVQLHGTQVDDLGIMMKLVEAMDLNAIAETFGK
jgi:hypothetical protein